jgi:predicted ATP-dependent endonuclease of OLD family
MFIKKLRIKNFRSFGKGENDDGTTIDLNIGVSAFIGRNGSGKTTVLEAIHYLIGNDYLPTKISEKDFHCKAGGIKDQIEIVGETESPFFLNIDVISNETSMPATVIVPCNKVKLTIKRRQKADRVLNDPYIIQKTVTPVSGEIDEDLYKDDSFKNKYKIISLDEIDSQVTNLESAKETIKDLIKGLSVDTQLIEKYYQVKYKLKSGGIREASFPEYNMSFNPSRIKGLARSYYLSKNRDSDVAGNYSFISKILSDLHWKYKRKESRSEENLIPEQHDKLSESLRNIIDEKSALIKEINKTISIISSESMNFQIDFVDIEQPYRSAFIAKNVNGKILLAENLGSGFNILIAYALFSYVAKQEKIPIVLLIDEPELHLHSDWQKKMYGLFQKQDNLQVIYSTQSENFISLKNPAQIRVFKNMEILPRINDELIEASDGESGTSREYLDDFARRNLHVSMIHKENLEMFFTKKCILVEGPGEKYALPKLITLGGCEFDKNSVSIIPVWGKTKICIYQIICKHFGINFFTLFDYDKEEDENKKIENNAQTSKLFSFSTSFEKKLGITGNNNKFQKLVGLVDELSDIDSLDQEIKDCINCLIKFIEC